MTPDLSVPARPHEPTEREALARELMALLGLDYDASHPFNQGQWQAHADTILAAGWRRVPSALPPTQPPNELRAEIEADFRASHHYADIAEHPTMKARLDGEVAYHMTLVDQYVAGLASLPPIPSEPK